MSDDEELLPCIGQIRERKSRSQQYVVYRILVCSSGRDKDRTVCVSVNELGTLFVYIVVVRLFGRLRFIFRQLHSREEITVQQEATEAQSMKDRGWVFEILCS